MKSSRRGNRLCSAICIINNLSLYIPNSAAAFQLNECRIIIKQRFYILRLNFIIRALCIQYFQQGNFAPVITVYFPLKHILRLFQNSAFVMFHLKCLRLELLISSHNFPLYLQAHLLILQFCLASTETGSIDRTSVQRREA